VQVLGGHGVESLKIKNARNTRWRKLLGALLVAQARSKSWLGRAEVQSSPVFAGNSLGSYACRLTHKSEKQCWLAATTRSAAAHLLASRPHAVCAIERKRRSLPGLAAGGSRSRGGQKNDERGLLHGTRFIAPVLAAKPGRGRNWHLF